MGHVGIQRKPLGFGSIFTNTLTFDITNNQSNRKNQENSSGTWWGGDGGGRLYYINRFFTFPCMQFEYCDSRNNN